MIRRIQTLFDELSGVHLELVYVVHPIKSCLRNGFFIKRVMIKEKLGFSSIFLM